MITPKNQNEEQNDSSSTAEKTISYTSTLDVRYESDVLVVGGGPAGVAAALAAARQGCSVRLIEAHSCLGGMGTAGLVPNFTGVGDGVNFLAGGIGRDVVDALYEANGSYREANFVCGEAPLDLIDAKCSTARSELEGIPIRAEVLKRVYDNLLTAAGVDLTFLTQVVAVVESDGHIHEAICAGKSGLFAARAGIFVDCSGDGDLASFAGAAYEKGDTNGTMMPGTLCSLWADVDWDRVNVNRPVNMEERVRSVEQALEDGVFSIEDRHLPGMWSVGETIAGGNVGHTFSVDGTDEESLTRAFLWGRKSMQEYERYYKEYRKGYEKMELVTTGSLLGVRETRRILGDYVLTLDDFQRRAVFDDEIGRYASRVDIHIMRPDRGSYDNFRSEFNEHQLGRGENYGIPYRTLIPKGLDNVLVAGRCISSDRQMQSSIRIMMACFITGQAAGVAAAMAVQAGVDTRGIDIKSLQARLKSMGGFLPNCAVRDDVNSC